MRSFGVFIIVENQSLYEVERAILNLVANKICMSNITVLFVGSSTALTSPLLKSIKVDKVFKRDLMSYAKNQCDLVSHEYVCFVSASSTFQVSSLENDIQVLSDNDSADLVVGDFEIIFPFFRLRTRTGDDIEKFLILRAPTFRVKFLSNILLLDNKANSFRQNNQFLGYQVKLSNRCVRHHLWELYELEWLEYFTQKKLTSIEKVLLFILNSKKLYIMRLIFSKLSLNFIGKKKVFLSVNFRSSEYKNLNKFAQRYNRKLIWSELKLQLRSVRNPYILEETDFWGYVSSLISNSVKHIKYIYVGLPGAKLVKRVLESCTSNQVSIHFLHGRPNGPKFEVPTDAAISEYGFKTLNVGKKIIYKNELRIFHGVGDIWIHGYKKGGNYSLKNLFLDIRKFLSFNKPRIMIHPTAVFLKIFMRIFYRNKVISNALNELHVNRLYVSSPSLLLKVRKMSLDERVSVIDAVNK